MSDGGIKIDLTPQQGAIALAVILGLGFFAKQMGGPVELDEAAMDVLRQQVSAVYLLKASEEVLARSKRDDSFGEGDLDQELEALGQVEILETTLKGKRERYRYVVRVRYTIGGGPSPDGKDVRYFDLLHSGGSWSVMNEVNETQFKMAF